MHAWLLAVTLISSSFFFTGISYCMHDSPAAAGKLTTPVGTTDEDHVGSITDMVVYLFF